MLTACCCCLGAKEWENTPVVERDKLIAKAKTSEKKHRLRKKFDGALKLLGEGFMSSEKFLVSDFHMLKLGSGNH